MQITDLHGIFFASAPRSPWVALSGDNNGYFGFYLMAY
ncbi:Uncharacterised protein [Bordetella pertussis]|nr:Uncharacterised protein [Bordetella pertussis]